MKNYDYPAYPQDSLYAASFALDDLKLYLDTHPCDAEALAYYDRLRCEEAAEEAKLDNTGYDLTAEDHSDPSRWTWIDGKWPWEGV